MYYQFYDLSALYNGEAGYLLSYPELPKGVSFNMGRFIDQPLQEPLRFAMDPESGARPKLVWGIEVLLMRQDVVETLQQAGVNNLQTFSAEIENPHTGETLKDYLAVNIFGLVAAADLDGSDMVAFSEPPAIDSVITNPKIDASKTGDALMFRMAESVMEIIIHESVKEALEAKYDTLAFEEC